MANDMQNVIDDVNVNIAADALGINRDEPAQKDPEPKDPDQKEEKPNVFVRAFRTVTTPVRWCARKIKESPAAAGLGAVAGAGAALGGRILVHAIRNRMDPGLGEAMDTTDADVDVIEAIGDVDNAAEELDIPASPFGE